MSKLKLAVAVIALSLGMASATQWIVGSPAWVKVVPNYTGTVVPYQESFTPILMMNVGGMLFVANYNSDRAKGWLDLAKSGAETGKTIAIYYESSYSLQVTSCGNYNASGCISKNATTNYPIINELQLNNY